MYWIMIMAWACQPVEEEQTTPEEALEDCLADLDNPYWRECYDQF